MKRKRFFIIPVFIPFGGCPEKCVFCDQRGITGEKGLPSVEDVSDTIEAHLSTWKGARPLRSEAAFYGGSFTALPLQTQISFLEAAHKYVLDGRLDCLRVSTRPDRISKEALDLLGRFKVETIELGVQTMSDEALKLSGRGHTRSHTVESVRLLKEMGFEVGLQLMPGLPGDTAESIQETTQEVISLAPDFVRVYPTLVLKGTALDDMYATGRYTPWTLEDMVKVCGQMQRQFNNAGIRVIRFGLQPTISLEASLVAGPYHPAFRDLLV
ncbi:MAG: radical SAM protein [Deltaproteobacteria bacterium]|nr:radical SAM protein [Deltaproteobacteria bacterium]